MKTVTPFRSTKATRSLRLRLSLGVVLGSLSLQSMAAGISSRSIPAPLPPLPAADIPTVATAGGLGGILRPRAALQWDAEFKEICPKAGDAAATFTFWFTNTSPDEIIITGVRASCGCTTAKIPAVPWKIVPGTNSPIEVSVDLRGKQGVISKTVTVDSTAGAKPLTFRINIPAAAPANCDVSFSKPSTKPLSWSTNRRP